MKLIVVSLWDPSIKAIKWEMTELLPSAWITSHYTHSGCNGGKAFLHVAKPRELVGVQKIYSLISAEHVGGAAVFGGLGGWQMAVLPFHLFWILLPSTECNYVNPKSTNKLHRRSGGEKLASVWHCFSFRSPHLLQMGRLYKQNC